MPENGDDKTPEKRTTINASEAAWIGIGAGIGAAIGAGIGTAGGEPAAGVGIGVAIGAGIGTSIMAMMSSSRRNK